MNYFDDDKSKVSKESTILSVEEYRELMQDNLSSDDQINERLAYLGLFVRSIIRTELESHEH